MFIEALEQKVFQQWPDDFGNLLSPAALVHQWEWSEGIFNDRLLFYKY